MASAFSDTLEDYTIASLNINIKISDRDTHPIPTPNSTGTCTVTPSSGTATTNLKPADKAIPDHPDTGMAVDGILTSHHHESDDDTISVHPSPTRSNFKLDPSSRLAIFTNELAEVASSRFKLFLASSTPAEPQSSSLTTITGKRRAFSLPTPPTTQKPTIFFPCPFYIHKPYEYRSCLKHDLRRIIDVKRHLWTVHKRPHDCKTCGTVFPTSGDRDAHIRSENRCVASVRAVPERECLSEEQLELLSRTVSKGGVEERWLMVWDVCFPDVQRPVAGAVGMEEAVRQLGMLREFWEEHGQRIIGEFLEGKGIHGCDGRRDERNLWALYDVVLGKMVERRISGLDGL